MLDDDGGGGGGGEETLTLEEELRNIQNHIKLTRLVLSIYHTLLGYSYIR